MQLDRQQYSSIAFLALAFLVLFLTLIKRFDNSDLAYVYWPLFVAFLFSKTPKLNFNLRWLICLGLITLIGIASTTMSKYPDVSFFRVEIYQQLFFFSFALYLTWRHRLSELMLPAFVGIVVVFIFITPFTLYEHFQFSIGLEGDQTKYISPKLTHYGHIRHYSYHAFIACCCCTSIAILAPKFRTIAIAAMLFCLLALILSGGRAGILAYVMFISCFGWVSLPKKTLIKVVLSVIAIGFVLLLLLKLSPLHSIVDSLIYRSKDLSSLNHILSGRPRIWSNALNSLDSQTILLGMGPGSYLWTDDIQFGAVQPHSVVVQLFIEYGYFGGSLIALCCGLFIYPLYKSTNVEQSLKTQHLCLCCLFSAFMIYSLVDGLFYHAYPMLHLAIIIPIWFSISNSSNKY